MHIGQRIMITGNAGSGKSTLARRLGEKTGLPVIYMDREFWNPGWIKPDKEEWLARQKNLFSGDKWVADGDYSSVMDIRLERADTVIYLDRGRAGCLFRAVRRSRKYKGKSRPDMAEGCPEKLEWAFIKYLWQFNRRVRPKLLERYKSYPKVNLVIMRNWKEVEQFIKSLS